ncbi:hypothetical protein SPAN111604_03320 [Sphingomonas antarctica]|uniref:hypothetical protein n=1 Tax=Sphingomonas antarctica TaxID=2040274 RepID=UPI0039E89639
MKMVIGCACAGTVLGGMYVHGDLSGGLIYNVPIHAAYLRAQAVHVDSSGMNVGSNIAPDVERYSDEAVKYSYRMDGQNVGKVAVALRPAGEGRTRVWVSFEKGDGDSTPMVERMRSELKLLGTATIGEQVAAAIDQRPVDKGVIQAANMAYIAAHTQDIFTGVAEKMNESAADFHKQDADDAYRHAQSSAGKPSVDLDHKSQ